ncbi:hypothetical protein UlMin_019315 [Ulmus minor]
MLDPSNSPSPFHLNPSNSPPSQTSSHPLFPNVDLPPLHPPNHLSIGDLCISLQSADTPMVTTPYFMAVGCIVALKLHTKNLVLRVLERACPAKAPWSIEELDKLERNMFRFIFQSKEDRRRAVEHGPWVVNKDLLFVKEWDPNIPLKDISFITASMWVQIHGIPPAFLSKENIWKVGEKAGSILNLEFNEHTRWKPFVRALLDVDVNRPLYPGFYLPMQSRHSIWIQIKYERVQDLCFRCGRLGHDHEVCSEIEDTIVVALDGSATQLFGPWMRSDLKARDCFHGAWLKKE